MSKESAVVESGNPEIQIDFHGHHARAAGQILLACKHGWVGVHELQRVECPGAELMPLLDEMFRRQLIFSKGEGDAVFVIDRVAYLEQEKQRIAAEKEAQPNIEPLSVVDQGTLDDLLGATGDRAIVTVEQIKSQSDQSLAEMMAFRELVIAAKNFCNECHVGIMPRGAVGLYCRLADATRDVLKVLLPVATDGNEQQSS